MVAERVVAVPLRELAGRREVLFPEPLRTAKRVRRR
jgi:hypothetical protein